MNGRNICHHEPRVWAFSKIFNFPDNSSCSAPGFFSSIVKVCKPPCHLTGLLVLLPDCIQCRSKGFYKSFISCQTKNIEEVIILTVFHNSFPTKPRIYPYYYFTLGNLSRILGTIPCKTSVVPLQASMLEG